MLMRLYRHDVSERIGLGKLSTLSRVSDLGREEGGDCGREKTMLRQAMVLSVKICNGMSHVYLFRGP